MTPTEKQIEAALAVQLSSVDWPAYECLHESDVRELLSAALAVEAGAVGVKPLEWHTTEDVTQNTSGCIHYKIEHFEGGGYGTYLHGYIGLHQNSFDTLDAAKAAAQADYEARILSALTTSPASSVVEEEAVAWQWRSRVKGGPWDAWENGICQQTPPPFMEVEHRRVPAAPAPQTEGHTYG